MELVYKKRTPEEIREYRTVLAHRRKNGFRCNCCQEEFLGNREITMVIVVLSVWEKICAKLREENKELKVSNPNIILCPECMEHLLGRKIEYHELGKMEDGSVIPVNIPYIIKNGYQELAKKDGLVLKREV